MTELETEAHRKAVEEAREVREKKKAVKAKRMSSNAKPASDASKEAEVTIVKIEDGSEASKDADAVTIIKVEEPTAGKEDTSSDEGEVKVEVIPVPVVIPTGLLTPAQGDGSDPLKKITIEVTQEGEKDVAVVEVQDQPTEEAVPITEKTETTDEKAKEEGPAKEADKERSKEGSDVKTLVVEVVSKDAPADSSDTPASPVATTVVKVEEEPKPIHDGITCDGCGVSPIVGSRYRCLEYVYLSFASSVHLLIYLLTEHHVLTMIYARTVLTSTVSMSRITSSWSSKRRTIPQSCMTGCVTYSSLIRNGFADAFNRSDYRRRRQLYYPRLASLHP